MSARIEHIDATTFHGRKGPIRNAFKYSIDYVMLDAEAQLPAPLLFSRNKRNVFALHDGDHGGPSSALRGARWVREVMARYEQPSPDRIVLLAQPRVLGHVFNPVSFWLCYDAADALIAVIAEVTNTFRQRHSYLCTNPNGGPITKADTMLAQKVFYVSPFQEIAGEYTFRFDIRDEAIDIVIDYVGENGMGLVATLKGARGPLTTASILRACVRRPFGSRRVLALIHWQASKLWWKGARARSCPPPLNDDVSY